MRKYDRSKSGFYGKKHSEYSRWLMSEGRKLTWAKKKEAKYAKSNIN